MRKSRAKKKAANRSNRRGRSGDRDTPAVTEVVERNEYLVRLTQTREIEVKVMATTSDVAQELAANDLGDVTAISVLGSVTRSVNEIG